MYHKGRSSSKEVGDEAKKIIGNSEDVEAQFSPNDWIKIHELGASNLMMKLSSVLCSYIFNSIWDYGSNKNVRYVQFLSDSLNPTNSTNPPKVQPDIPSETPQPTIDSEKLESGAQNLSLNIILCLFFVMFCFMSF